MILQKIKQSLLFRSAFVYGVSTAINAAIPFFLLPILTRYLTPEDYGLVTVFMTLITFFNIFIGLNLNGVVFNKYFFSEGHSQFNFSEFLSQGIAILFMAFVVNIVVVILFLKWILQMTLLPTEWVFIAASTSVFQYFCLIQLAIYQAQNATKKYATLLIFQSICNVCLSLMFVTLMNLNWVGRAMGITFALYAAGIVGLVLLIKKYNLKISFKTNYYKEILSFCLPLVPHTLGAVLISLVDRFFIIKLVSVKEAGLYQVGIQISMAIGFFTEAFNKAFAPWLYSALRRNEVQTNFKIVRFTYGYFVFILACAVMISAIPESLLVLVIGERFLDSKNFILWSSFAFAFNGMYLMVCNYIFYSEKTKYLSYITLPIGCFNIFLSYLLIQKIGSIGASISMAISYFLMFIFTWYRSSKLIPMPWLSALKSGAK